MWVPVEEINDMAQCSTSGGNCNLQLDTNGNLECTTHNSEEIVGKLYATSTNQEGNFGTVNTTYDEDSGLREPAIVKDYDNDTINCNTVGLTLAGLKNDYKLMAESVAKNGGFYIGRYEASLTSANATSAGTSGTMQSKQGVIPTAASRMATYKWYGLYDKSKSYTVSENSVKSSMIWGSQYDAMLNWAKDGADSSKITDTTGIGNNSSGKVTIAGNTTYSNDSINNIRDLGGNLREWTLEAYTTNTRVIRGAGYNSSYSPSFRGNLDTGRTGTDYGTRLTLYIK